MGDKILESVYFKDKFGNYKKMLEVKTLNVYTSDSLNSSIRLLKQIDWDIVDSGCITMIIKILEERYGEII